MTRDNNGTCRSCQAPVRWATTNNGKRTMLDEQPDQAEGTVALVIVPTYGDGPLEIAVALKDGDERGVNLLTQAREGGVPLRTVHFFTCPERTSP